MMILPTNLYRAAQVRELDRRAIEVFDILGYTLMQRAGSAAFAELRTKWPEAKAVLVLAGTGNNGGDGFVVARLASLNGLTVQVIQMGDPARIRGDALQARDDYLEAEGEIQQYNGAPLPSAEVIVDALLGTGLEREVSGPWQSVIEAVNRHPAPVLAVDIPSGLHSDTGMPLGETIRAQCTVSFIGLKQGQFTGKAMDYCGELVFNDLQVPQDVYNGQAPSAQILKLEHDNGFLTPRLPSSHKGQFGHVLVVGGGRGMSGAPRMAGEAAARIGAGLVSVVTHSTHASVLNLTCPVLMVHAVDTGAELQPLLTRASVIAIGPGLGQSAWSQTLLDTVIDADKPLVVDADALNMLAKKPLSRDDWVLTPHPGEAARMLGISTREVQQDRYSAAAALHSRYGGICVLKGAGTLVQSEDRTGVCRAGNPGMSTGGMGDVLTGIIAGLLAQGLNPLAAAELGVCLHARAGDAASVDGERGMLAIDLLTHLRHLVNP
jgi:hydroxyethylthiazole kinase-like uncharacterized protein yjeF